MICTKMSNKNDPEALLQQLSQCGGSTDAVYQPVTNPVHENGVLIKRSDAVSHSDLSLRLRQMGLKRITAKVRLKIPIILAFIEFLQAVVEIRLEVSKFILFFSVSASSRCH